MVSTQELCLDAYASQGLGAASEDESFVHVLIRDAAIVHHVDLPSVLRTLHVPQIPIEQPDGITSPAAFAAASIVSVSLHLVVTPERAKAISAWFCSSGITSSGRLRHARAPP